MDIHEIGKNARTVWRLLSDRRDWSYGELKLAIGLRGRELNAALGWLAHEGGMEVSERQDGTKCFSLPHYNAYL